MRTWEVQVKSDFEQPVRSLSTAGHKKKVREMECVSSRGTRKAIATRLAKCHVVAEESHCHSFSQMPRRDRGKIAIL